MAKNSLKITFLVFIGLIIVMVLVIYYCTATIEADRTPEEPRQEQPGMIPPDTL